jgi:hydrogenase maturation protein HypF
MEPVEKPQRLRLEIGGAVQGVGFRPFVYRLARDLDLTGWVLNDSRGAFIEVEGERSRLEDFRERLAAEKPPRAVVLSIDSEWLSPASFSDFVIRSSDEAGAPTAVILPDVATCSDCLAEVLSPADRRYRYPFTNCTNCGPRFTIVEALPYDRPNTTMRRFELCPECRGEYEEPLDRRFHAQPNACPVCGPRLTLSDSRGETIAEENEALIGAVRELEGGRTVALKGIGGFLLLVDATNGSAIATLRQRKQRYEKPLALMVRDLEQAADLCQLEAGTAELLSSPEAPIVLLERLEGATIAKEVAPGNPYLGIMLPYSPLHHLLLQEFGSPLVATSGNLSDEPICIDNREALERLGKIADSFLLHDRPIARHVDDSVLHLVEGRPQPLRRARGWAPLPVVLEHSIPTILAVGGHLKNTAALSVDDKVFLSQHIGDMETPQAHVAFERVIADFLGLYDASPVALARDLHPDYPSSQWIERLAGVEEGWEASLCGLPVFSVQHHHAHLAACLAEHGFDGEALGVTWDGTGYGPDGTVWGGEFLVGNAAGYGRLAALRSFRLPGGEAAVKEPRRSALAVLWEIWGEQALDREELAPIGSFTPGELRPLAGMLARGLRSPRTTSAGRLFDAVASLLDLRHRVAFEGQAAMALEFISDRDEQGAYPLPLRQNRWEEANRGPLSERAQHVLDWQPLLEELLADSRRGVGAGIIAARFHNALVEGIVRVAEEAGQRQVALTGGCFQNRLLSEQALSRLAAAGFEVLVHRQVPANDGGLSLGQITVAAARLEAGGI